MHGGFIGQVSDIGAGKADGGARQRLQFNVVGQGLVFGMNLENLVPPFDIGQVDCDLAIEAAGAQQGWVQHIGAVGGGDHDDIGVVVEAVHFGQQLVQGLLALVVPAAQAGAATAADGVDLVDEDDGGGVFFGALEEIAHAGGADADEHLDEFRGGDTEEGDVGFAGDSARHQRFADAGRAHQQDAARHLGADFDVFLGLFEEVHDFRKLQLGRVLPGDIIESNRRHLGRFLARLGLTEGEDAVHLPLGAPSHPNEETDDEHKGQEIQNNGQPGRGAAVFLVDRPDAILQAQALDFGPREDRDLRGEASYALGSAGGRDDDDAAFEFADDSGGILVVEGGDIVEQHLLVEVGVGDFRR